MCLHVLLVCYSNNNVVTCNQFVNNDSNDVIYDTNNPVTLSGKLEKSNEYPQKLLQ